MRDSSGLLIRERDGALHGGEVQDALPANTDAIMRQDDIEAPGVELVVVQGQHAGDNKLLHPAGATGQRRNRAIRESANQLTHYALEVEDAADYFGEVNALDVGRPRRNITIVAGAHAGELAGVLRHSSLDAGDLVSDALCSGHRTERDDESNGDRYAAKPTNGSALDIPLVLGLKADSLWLKSGATMSVLHLTGLLKTENWTEDAFQEIGMWDS